MTPAEELRAAAEQLREDSRAALLDSPLPWTAEKDVVVCGNGGIIVDRSCDPDDVGDLPYIARVHPGIGTALADWLDSYASHLAASTHPGWQETTAGHPLAVARQILGTQSPGPRHPYDHPDDEQPVIDAGSIDDYEGDQP